MYRRQYGLFRLITTCVTLIVVLFINFPFQTSVVLLSLVIMYFILRNLPNSPIVRNALLFDSPEIRARKEALKYAELYLAPYDNIWNNLKLFNKQIFIKLNSNGDRISAKELKGSKRTLDVVLTKFHTMQELWNILCFKFDSTMTFDALIELFERYKVKVYVKGENKDSQTNNEQINSNNLEVTNTLPTSQVLHDTKEKSPKIDINNATEQEIATLPGINVILAKKIIKKRQEINGFKTIDDVLIFLKLKSHMTDVLRSKIIVNKIEGVENIQYNTERSLDL